MCIVYVVPIAFDKKKNLRNPPPGPGTPLKKNSFTFLGKIQVNIFVFSTYLYNEESIN